LVHVYTGNGKGKTTASLGLAFRAVGKGLRVLMIQFMKGDIEYGEVVSARNTRNITLIQKGRPDFVNRDDPDPVDVKLAEEALALARERVSSRDFDVVILDEVNVAADWKLISWDDVYDLVDGKPEDVELVCTGRGASQGLIDRADYATEMKEIKHPFQRGVLARDGIDH